MKTVLPHKAIVKCDMRLVADQTKDDAFAKVEAHVKQYAPEVEFVPLGGMNPARTPVASPFTEPIRQSVIAAQGAPPLLIPSLGGSLPIYVFNDTLGIPTFTVPYANADQANHAPNENLEVERFINGIKTTAALLSQLGAMRRPDLDEA